MGSQGQGSYAAANAFMDAVAQRRRGLGLPAQSINWGPWGERGMAASLTARERERLGATGFEMMPTADALAALDRTLDLNPPQVMIVPARWDVVCGRFAEGQVPPLLRSLGKARQESSGSVKTVTALKPRLDAVPDSEKYGVVVAFVREMVMKALGLSASGSISLRTPFTDLGLDSLMAVELRNGLSEATGLRFRSSLVYDFPCIEDLAMHICADLPQLSAEVGATEEGEL
jgi:acyl carrier protein